jgi:hypothetical protein
MLLVFSQRHENALKEKKLKVSLSTKLRQKIIYCMVNHNQWYGWNNQDSILYDSLFGKLLETYGRTDLRGYIHDSLEPVQHIEDFIKRAWPPQVIDSIELFNQLLKKQIDKILFGKAINTVFRAENSEYRLLENEIIVLDSTFLESSALNRAFELLKSNAFEKACEDFLSARNNYTSGDYAGTIVECNNAMESALKKILNVKKGAQNKLKNQLMKSGIIPEYFQGFSEHFEGLLQAAFTIANQSARHGSKEPHTGKNKIDRPLAAFILHLTGSLMVFLIERYEETVPDEDDIPF